MKVGPIMVGIVTLVAAISLLTYGFYAMNPAAPMTGISLTIIGIFLIIAAFLIIFTQLFAGSSHT